METQKEHINNPIWEDETAARQESIQEFLKNYLATPLESRSRYNSMTDLHFSGTNMDVPEKIANGTAQILRIDVLYEDDQPKKIHVVFDSEGKGQNIDVYLQNKALEDFLSERPAGK